MYVSLAGPEPIVLSRVSFPDMISSRRALVATLLLLAAACHPDFELTKFPTNETLYRAATEEFTRGRWDNAVSAFEKLTTDLPARDTLLPRSHWFLSIRDRSGAEPGGEDRVVNSERFAERRSQLRPHDWIVRLLVQSGHP